MHTSLLLCTALLLTMAAPVAAQTITVETPTLEELLDPERPPLRLRPSHERRRRLAQHLLSFGPALIAGGAMVATLMATRCYDEPPMRSPRISGGITAGVGLAFVLGGTIRLARLPAPSRPSRRRHAAVFTTLATVMTFVTAGVLFGANFLANLGCINS